MITMPPFPIHLSALNTHFHSAPSIFTPNTTFTTISDTPLDSPYLCHALQSWMLPFTIGSSHTLNVLISFSTLQDAFMKKCSVCLTRPRLDCKQ